MKKISLLCCAICLLFCDSLFSQKEYEYSILWSYDSNKSRLSFEGADATLDSIFLPIFSKEILLDENNICTDMKICDISALPCNDTAITNHVFDSEPVFHWNFGVANKNSYCSFTLQPYFFDEETQHCMIITNFKINITTSESKKEHRFIPKKSILSEGLWYKFKIYSQGIYCLTYEDFLSYGINVDNLKSDNIKIYSNAGYNLPESNAKSELDNAPEIPVIVKDNNDGTFDKGDSIFFYLEGPHAWRYDTIVGVYKHFYNLYTDTAYFLLNISDTEGKRIPVYDTSQNINTDFVINKYSKLYYYRKQVNNFLNSGNVWYGEAFGNNIFTVPEKFTIAAPVEEIPVHSYLMYNIACSSNEKNQVYIAANDDLFSAQTINRSSGNLIAREKNTSHYFYCKDTTVYINVSHISADSKGKAYLGYLFLNLRSMLAYENQWFTFRDPYYHATQPYVRYDIDNANISINVWNITNPISPVNVPVYQSGRNVSIYYDKQRDKQPEEFIAFYTHEAQKPIFEKQVPNQDLFSNTAIDNLYIVPKGRFSKQAEDLGIFHQQRDNQTYKVVDLEEIYNEFSCGAIDLSSIRNYIRLIYSASGGEYPKNVVLFGSTNFDFKSIISDEPNLMPTFESYESLDYTMSYGTDDYYVLMDESEGSMCNGIIDIPIGRIPFSRDEEIDIYINKVKRYYQSHSSADGAWKSTYTGVADDGNDRNDSKDNIYSVYMEKMEKLLHSINSNFVFDKVYIDAFEHKKNKRGYTVPDASKYLVNAFNNGSLIVSYFGHGGSLGWAGESLFNTPEVQQIHNLNNMPMVIAATCDYYEYDKLHLYPSSKHLMLNTNGGAISLVATSRVNYVATCYELISNAVKLLNDTIINNSITSGDVFMADKRSPHYLFKSVIFFGDPAVKLNYPDFNIIIDSLNDNSVGDTEFFQQANLIKVSGHINTSSDFNGFIKYQLYDQPVKHTTFGHEYNTAMDFFLRNKIINKGICEVRNCKFEIEFRLPNDVNQGDSTLKLQLYAYDTVNNITAIGSIDNIKYSDESNGYTDNDGPIISAYLNEKTFEDNDIVSNNSVLFLSFYDESGIDYYGNTLGREITYILNGDYDTEMYLNSYFKPDTNTYHSGKITLQLDNLPLGDNKIKISAYDIFGNKSEIVISFRIVDVFIPEITKVYVYPNPIGNETVNFCIEHNMGYKSFEVQLRIVDLSGKIVSEIVRSIADNNLCISWEKESGIHGGVYVYQITLSVDKTRKTTISNKILVK